MLDALVGKVRHGVLRALDAASLAGLGVREIARRARASPGAVYRELGFLARCGIARRDRRTGGYRLAADHDLATGMRRLIGRAATSTRLPAREGAVSAVVQRIESALAREKEVRLAILFGSAAKGTLDVGSDLDVAVAGRAPLPFAARRRIAAALAQTIGRPVDLVDLSTAGVAVSGEALLRGRTILDRESGLRGRLLAKLLTDRADFGRLHERILSERRRRWIAG